MNYIAIFLTTAQFAYILTGSIVFAQDATWQGAQQTNNWNNTNNWSTNQVPTGVATFPSALPVQGTPITVNFSQVINNIDTIRFVDSGTPPGSNTVGYQFALDNTTLNVRGQGFVGLSGNGEFRVGNAAPATLNFFGSSTTGRSPIIVDRFGTLYFRDTSSAATSTITIMAGGVVDISATTPRNFNVGAIASDGTLKIGSKNLNIAGSAQTVFSGSITDGGIQGGTGGSVTVTGGSVYFTGPNSYTGGTSVVGGELVVDDRGTLGAASGSTAVQNARLNLGLTSQVQNTLLLLSGSVVNGSIAANLFDVRSGNISSNLIGTGRLEKSSDGTVSLSGANSYTGSTIVNAGTLNVTGSLVSSVTVNSGVLAGSGRIRALTVNAGAAAHPGAVAGAPTTLTVAGDVVFNVGSTYRVALSPTASDRITATGTATITGGLVDVRGLVLATTPRRPTRSYRPTAVAPARSLA